MSNASDTFLTGVNADFLEAQYARFLENPSSVDESFAQLFRSLGNSGKPIVTEGLKLPPPQPYANGNGAHTNGATNGSAAISKSQLEALNVQSKFDQAVFAFRLRGHLVAQLDPLGVPRPVLEHVADISMVSKAHFSETEAKTLVEPQTTFDEKKMPLGFVIDRLRKTYCEHIGVEYMHMFDSDKRRWLMRRMEFTENRTEFTLDEQKRILKLLTQAEAFEQTINTKFPGQKRFSCEGGESQIPMVDELLQWGAPLGVREVVVGMAHRGRLSMLATVMAKPADEIFSEIAGPNDPKLYLNRGDVKYHMGYSSDRETVAGQKVHLSMAFNPSHLGVVHPVVEGRVRAKQDRAGEGGRHAIVPLVIHGDAAFSGQGLVAETLNLSGVPGYDTGGTIHLIVNNQVGYTTEARQGRTPLYCTGIAQMLDIPIFHVNGDDPEACVHVMRIATEYRQRYHTDVVIDLVCYRKYGHNEGDSPEFTQPTMYSIIRSKKPVRVMYGEELVAKGRIKQEDIAAVYEEEKKAYFEAHARSVKGGLLKDPSQGGGVWAKSKYVGGLDSDTQRVDTGVAIDKLKGLLTKLAATPEGFTLNPRVQKILDERMATVEGKRNVDWGSGEMLAYATLATEGYRIRVTGQDTERGTFSHRHAVLHDVPTGNEAFPLGALEKGQAPALILNSPLSEMACMGFEFGYSLDMPDALVAWEAQFGDFANNGQVMIDQFIAAAEDKWRRLSGLTLLLPHGYEGGGPEHSTARLERFLELAAEDNLQVCYPTNAAQIFHLLRRQAVRPLRKPLVVMTPKSMLKAEYSMSPWADFEHGPFKRVIGETDASVAPENVTRLLLCSGKVFYDLVAGRTAAKDPTIAIARLEQLYPLPVAELQAELARYPKLTEVMWVQEEPKNSGGWRFMLEPLLGLLKERKLNLRYAGRVESASPATAYIKTHQYEQNLLVQEALSRVN